MELEDGFPIGKQFRNDSCDAFDASTAHAT
jgi:hypothetical protein